jgi:hypothetical protein
VTLFFGMGIDFPGPAVLSSLTQTQVKVNRMLGVQETPVLNKGGHGVRSPMDGKTARRVGTFLYRKRQPTFPLLYRLYDHCPANVLRVRRDQ